MQLPLMITSRDKAQKAMHDIQLEGLQEIDRICRKHDIKYSLGGGTCLGQVRHGGFIPWDDDIDLDMTVENYERFLEIAPSELDSNRFRLYTRDTESNVFRSSARVGILGTTLSLTNWEQSGRECNVFVDIFRCGYMPDDEKKRNRIASRLFLIRCVQHYRELGEFANKLDPRHKLLVRILNAMVPVKMLRRYEDHLVHCTKGKTGWILDDSIIHGAYGGYPSKGVDEYTDVEFEGMTVMNKKDTHDFLVSLYGENYMAWLPPTKRISHHTWTVFNLGHYAEKYGLDESYKDFMTVSYTPAKLRQMKLVTDSMIDDIISVCDKHGINYAIPQFNKPDKGCEIDDIDSLWTQPSIIMMLRDDYDTFAGICEKEFNGRMSYQSHNTDPGYYYDYARVHLNYTQIRDKHMRAAAEKKLNRGFYVKIIPLDNYCEDEEAKDNFKSMRYWRRLLHLKWRTPDAGYFLKTSFKNKMKLVLNHRYSLEDMYNRVSSRAQAYNSSESPLCFDSSHQLGGVSFDKNEIISNREVEVPRNVTEAKTIDELIASVSKHYGPCYLTYYDEPDRQLSILRYDEKKDRLLSNEELFGPSGDTC